MTADLGKLAVMTTACWRPYYLEQTLAGWAQARGFAQIRGVYIALGVSDRLAEAQQVIADFAAKAPVPVHTHVDNPRVGPWAAIGNMTIAAFADPGVEYLVVNDEDTLVADDVLELYGWALAAFAGNPDVLLVNGHSRCGQGWDGPDVHDDPDADPAVVRLQPYFTPWSWATWRDRWASVLLPDWDWDGSTATQDAPGGYDWHIAKRVMPGRLAVVPDASRSQHIGDREGMFSTPDTLAWSKAASFREHRDPVTFRVEPA